MSTQDRNTNAADAPQAATAVTLRVVPTVPDTPPAMPARSGNQRSVWAALEAQPGATTAQLAIIAGIGRSTAGKILAEWAKDGSVDRTPGGIDGGRRTPDRWAIAVSTGNTTHGEGTSPIAMTSDATNPLDQTGTEKSTEPRATDAQNDRPDRSVAHIPADDGAEGTDPLARAAEVHTAPATSDAHEGPRHREVVLGDKPARLGSGALRGLVEDYLRDHAADTFGPGAIGKALGRSAGAVNNALEKLVETGYARRTQDKPKRFQFNASLEPATE